MKLGKLKVNRKLIVKAIIIFSTFALVITSLAPVIFAIFS
ncbi:MAG: hypothetical protein UX79_C0010G0002 [candidate division WWE3 bacterium GW2011_GWB1_47_11]|uniref:Uncharacterized protein n=2 Tax=Katanobacteria TaxID=422282 RepID=A0A0G1UIG8_UNCKA|nr:MAG: hypothetical protein UX73_C0007G0003 [candidate division WWE3 bacterium GW2011_GWC1_47_10]KKU57495.1 MAG: hypothetical protein UX79_C0010G0002 [candidate division WWE3 bacterium GW2011_GWB1_47_11]